MSNLNPQGASPTNCTKDGDCPSSLVCYSSSLPWTEGNSYCLCSTWYGWTLSATDPLQCELTASTIASIVFFGIFGFIILICLIVVLKTIRDVRREKKSGKSLALATALIYLLGWTICGILRVIFASLEFGIPSAQTAMPFGPEWKYSPYGVYQTKPLFAASTVFGMLVDYQIVVVWFSVVLGSTKLHKRTNKRVQILKIVVALLELIYIIGASILIGQDYVSRFLYFSLAFFIFALAGYGFTGYALYTLLSGAVKKQTARTNDHMMSVARRIQFTALANAFLILCNIVCMIGLGETNESFKELGNFAAAGFHNAQIGVMTAQICVITYYLYLSFSSRSKNKKNSLTSPQMSRNGPGGEQKQRAYKSENQQQIPVNNDNNNANNNNEAFVIIDNFYELPLEDGQSRLNGGGANNSSSETRDRQDVGGTAHAAGYNNASLPYTSPPSSYSVSSPDDRGASNGMKRTRKVLITQHQDDDELLSGDGAYHTPRSEPSSPGLALSFRSPLFSARPSNNRDDDDDSDPSTGGTNGKTDTQVAHV